MRGIPAARRGSVPGEVGRRRSIWPGVSARPIAFLIAATALAGLGGCNEVKGRRLIQKGNDDYHDGRYPEAVQKFEEAEKLIPNFPTLWLNKGYTCKRMIVPGAKNAETFKAAQCAVKAFLKFKELAPDDVRGDMLYTQTLFDADRFSTIAEIYEKRFQEDPKDKQAVNVLMQVYSKWDMATLGEGGKLDDALKWYRTAVEQSPDDAETYYALGTFIYTQLMTKGGGTDKQLYDPRPGAVNKAQPLPPLPTDIMGEQRVSLSDEGIQYLEKALELRPTYSDAMTYLNLLWRQRSFSYFNDPKVWFENLQNAEQWKEKTLAILRERAGVKPEGTSPAKPTEIKPQDERAQFGAHTRDDVNEEAGDEEDEADDATVAAPDKERTAKKKKAPRKGRRKR